MFSNKARLIAAVALLICVLCSSMLVFFENGSEPAIQGEDVVVTAATEVSMTKLFWPFSSPPSKKTTPAPVKASTSPSIHALASRASKSSPQLKAANEMEVKAIRQAQEVMRKLVREDKEAAHKQAEETYIKHLVAQHIKEAKDAAQAKIAAAKAAILRLKLAAEAKASEAKAAAAAVALRKKEQHLLRVQLCGPSAHKKLLTPEQCNAAIKLKLAKKELKAREEFQFHQASEYLKSPNTRLQRAIEAMARGLRKVDSEGDDVAAGTKGQP